MERPITRARNLALLGIYPDSLLYYEAALEDPMMNLKARNMIRKEIEIVTKLASWNEDVETPQQQSIMNDSKVPDLSRSAYDNMPGAFGLDERGFEGRRALTCITMMSRTYA